MSRCNHVVETCPRVASFLTSPVQPIEQTVQDVPSKCHNVRVVSINSIVMVIAYKHSVNPTHNLLGLPSSHHTDFLVHFFAFLYEFLSARSPPHLELSALVICPLTPVPHLFGVEHLQHFRVGKHVAHSLCHLTHCGCGILNRKRIRDCWRVGLAARVGQCHTRSRPCQTLLTKHCPQV